MIKIIKTGTKQIITCDKCGCVFSFDEEDLHHLEYHNGKYEYVSGTKHGYKKYVFCPQCEYDNNVSQTRCVESEELKCKKRGMI